MNRNSKFFCIQSFQRLAAIRHLRQEGTPSPKWGTLVPSNFFNIYLLNMKLKMPATRV